MAGSRALRTIRCPVATRQLRDADDMRLDFLAWTVPPAGSLSAKPNALGLEDATFLEVRRNPAGTVDLVFAREEVAGRLPVRPDIHEIDFVDLLPGRPTIREFGFFDLPYLRPVEKAIEQAQRALRRSASIP